MRPYMECPSYDRCAVNKCPLDPKYKERRPHSEDAETKCRLSKVKRVSIGSSYPGILPYLGMTGHEYVSTDNVSKMAAGANG